jgi:hypothetical protein
MTNFTANAKKTTDLKQFDSADGIEFVLDKSGEVFYLGWKALAQVCSIGLEEPIFDIQVKRTIESHLSKGTKVQTPFEAEVETPRGLQLVTLIPRQLAIQAIKQHNPDLSEEMADAGQLVYLNQLLGRSYL